MSSISDPVAVQRQRGPNYWPTLAIVTTVLCWASAFVAIRFVGQDFSAGSLTLGRLAVGVVTLTMFLIARQHRLGRQDGSAGPATRFKPSRAEWLLLALCGLAWFGVYNISLNAAEQILDAGTTSMLVNIGPLVIALLAGAFLGEGFPRPLLFGMIVSLAGAVVIGLATTHGEGISLKGILLAVLAAVAYAIGVIAQKPVLARQPALQVTLSAAAIGAIVCLPFLPDLLRELAEANMSSILWLVYLGVFPTAIAFTTWAYALARTSAGKLGSTTYVVPPLTILMGWLFLGEVPVALAYLGGAICLLGVAIARRPPKRQTS